MSKVEKIDNDLFYVHNSDDVQVKKTGNITEIRSSLHKSKQTIQKISANQYIVMDTGEVRYFKHTDNRIENLVSIRQSMNNLRDIINTNCTDATRCKFLTLTYRENMNDTKRLYTDIKKFFMRMKYHLKNSKFEYITCIEPQKYCRAWHAHIILIFDRKAPFIPNDKLAEIWGYGFTKVTNIDNVDNIGIYLSAYMCDLDVEQASLEDLKSAREIREVETVDDKGHNVSKYIIKGGRLKYYPTGMRFYRCSRGIKRPEIINCPYHMAKDMVKNTALTYEKTIKILNEGNEILNIIRYEQYNSKAKLK